jgi:hypothetical protein
MSKYAIGERWYCDRSVGGNSDNRPPFYFLIAENSDRRGHKMCRIEVAGHLGAFAYEYSHKHLNKYAKHVPKEAA